MPSAIYKAKTKKRLGKAFDDEKTLYEMKQEEKRLFRAEPKKKRAVTKGSGVRKGSGIARRR